jgi:tRNA (mo5U34)-methyltransferase
MNRPPEKAWYHTISLPDGTCTPGIFDCRPVAATLPWPSAVAGGRCLDVGTADGFWAFEMEKRGAAEVIAIDVDDSQPLSSTQTAGVRVLPGEASPPTNFAHRFASAHRALGSRVKRIACSVYDLGPLIAGRFDVVFCGTVLTHLREPVRALQRMREVCQAEMLLIECVDARLDLLAQWAPCARLEPAPGQWWRFNTAGLLRAVELAGFEVLWTSSPFVTPFGPGMSYRNTVRSALAKALLATPSQRARALAVGFARGTYDIAIRARPLICHTS